MMTMLIQDFIERRLAVFFNLNLVRHKMDVGTV